MVIEEFKPVADDPDSLRSLVRIAKELGYRLTDKKTLEENQGILK